jgi:hypothetical protein
VGPSEKTLRFGSYTVSIENVTRIFRDLSRVVSEQGDVDLAQWVKPEDQSDKEFAQTKAALKERAYRITITVRYSDGSSAFGMDDTIFETKAQGPLITNIYMTNITAYAAAANFEPVNRFRLMFDFAQPPLMDANTVVSGPTPNQSALSVNSDRPGWLAGVERSVLQHIDKHHNIRGTLHGSFVYDYGLMIFGAPFSLYLCWLAMPWINDNLAEAIVLQAAAFLYVFLLGIWAYRVLFSYFRWAYPIAELAEQYARPRRHRLFWWGIVIIVAGKVFWDLVDPYLSLRAFWLSG